MKMPLNFWRLWALMAIPFVFGFGHNLPKYWDLHQTGLKLNATVTALTPNFHRTFQYEYKVEGVKFGGSATIVRENPKIGQKISITYLPSDPSVSIAGDALQELVQGCVLLLLSILLLPTFGALAVLFTGRNPR